MKTWKNIKRMISKYKMCWKIHAEQNYNELIQLYSISIRYIPAYGYCSSFFLINFYQHFPFSDFSFDILLFDFFVKLIIFTEHLNPKTQKLRRQILTLHDLHKTWSSSDIANELQNSDCPPPQTRRALVRYIDYTIKRGTM